MYDVGILRHHPLASQILKDPACTDMADLLRKGRALAAKRKKETSEDAAAGSRPATSGREAPPKPAAAVEKAAGAAGAAAAAATAASGTDGCPLDKGELGAATWGLVSQSCGPGRSLFPIVLLFIGVCFLALGKYTTLQSRVCLNACVHRPSV